MGGRGYSGIGGVLSIQKTDFDSDFDFDFDLDAPVLWFFHDNGIKIIAAAESP